ncbi:hypothetical protein FRC12_000944 [Ceratobasidium sp. 428]|nr:hypothetical protein FRC12_000944 [Ceratobasidium sp. 428]
MVAGHPSLREYPRFLRLQDMSAAPYMPRDRQFIIKDLLLHVPSVVDLELSFDTDTILYLARDTKYPFALRSLRTTPPKEAAFVEFLKTQPQIERIVFYGDPGEADLYPVPGWYGVASPLEPHILPSLKSVQGNRVNVCFLVPYRPVTSVSVHLFQEDLGFHKMLAKASAPLERLSECMQLHEAPWETGIVSQCLPSLNFCRTSLSEYSLHVKAFPPHLDGRSVLACLKASQSRIEPLFSTKVRSLE